MFGIPLPFPIPSWALKAVGVLAVLVTLMIAIHSWVSAIRRSAVVEVQAQAEHTARVQDNKQADISVHSAVKEGAAQQALAAVAATVKQKVPHHVHEPAAPRAIGCVTYGLIRVLDAAALGIDPDDLALPAGKSDDACAPITNADLAAAVADNYASALSNAEQLNALEADIRARVDATAPAK